MTKPVDRPYYKRGRKRKYNDQIILDKKIDEYFAKCPDTRIITTKDGQTVEVPVFTITGLVLYLGFADRKSFYEYEEKPEFTHIIKRARTKIEREYEKLLQAGLGSGAIFALKNFGWSDKSEVEHTGSVTSKQINIDLSDKTDAELIALLNDVDTKRNN